MTPAPARRALWGGAAVGAAALAACLAVRLGRVGDDAIGDREAVLVARAGDGLQRDVETLARVAASLQRDAAFTSAVDGGGSALRPAALFSLLESALPRGPGWGVVFFDRTGRAVAWAGDGGNVEAESPGAGDERWSASFRVTRFRLVHRSPRGERAERRGVLVVSRSYPTGFLRPDLLDDAPFAPPSVRRVRVRESNSGAALVAISIEPASREASEDDVRRARGLPFALVASAGLLTAAVAARRSALGAVGTRLVLLLGAPRAESGVWRALTSNPDAGFGLAASPMDLALTGIAALVVCRAFLAAARDPRPLHDAVPRRVLRGALGLAAALAVPALAHAAGRARPDLADDIGLVPASASEAALRVGAFGVALGLTGVGAVLLARSGVPRGARWAGVAGAGLLFLAAGARDPHPAVGPVAAVLVAAGLAGRLRTEGASDGLGRAATAVLIAAAAALVAGAGLQAGVVARLDDELRRADRHEGDDMRFDLADWSRRVADPALQPVLPAGAATETPDLARALWLRGGIGDFPEAGDSLVVRGPDGRVVSAFGLLRPGADEGGATLRVALPVPDLSGSFSRVWWTRESERDPLYAAAASGETLRVPVERLETDVSGRARSRRAAERGDLGADLLARARTSPAAHASVTTAAGPRRVRVRERPPGFVAWLAPADRPIRTFACAVAAGEMALPFALMLLLGPSARPRAERKSRDLFAMLATYRARLLALLLLLAAGPLLVSLVVVREALDAHATAVSTRRAQALLAEALRALPPPGPDGPVPADLNRVAAVVGADLLYYRDGRIVAASRAIPVAAEVAGERLSGPVAAALAEGRAAAAARRRASPSDPLRIVEAAEPASADGRDALAAVVLEDEAGRNAVDGLVLFAVAVAVLGVFAGGRAALSLSRPLASLEEAAESVGAGRDPAPLLRPAPPDLARVLEAFETMAARVRERTASLAREREAAVSLLSSLTAAALLFRRRDGAVLLANEAADRMLPGGTLAERLAAPELEPLREILATFAARGQEIERRVTVREGGSERVLRVVAAPLPPEGDEPRALLLLEDLTDFVRAERLTGWVDAARAVAHDVKNPLTPVRLAAERLLRFGARGTPPPPEALAGAATSILRQVEILTERIGRLARFSDPSSLRAERLDRRSLEALLGEVAAGYAGHDRIVVSATVAPDAPGARLDREIVRDALSNLVVNAVEAIGDRRGSVTLAAERDAEAGGVALRLSCTDDGPGVEGAMFERLFEPAFSTKSRGSGMGLAAVKRAAERHGGSVFARPREGGGLVVGLELPAEDG